jgi:hypothetical protein
VPPAAAFVEIGAVVEDPPVALLEVLPPASIFELPPLELPLFELLLVGLPPLALSLLVPPPLMLTALPVERRSELLALKVAPPEELETVFELPPPSLAVLLAAPEAFCFCCDCADTPPELTDPVAVLGVPPLESELFASSEGPLQPSRAKPYMQKPRARLGR